MQKIKGILDRKQQINNQKICHIVLFLCLAISLLGSKCQNGRMMATEHTPETNEEVNMKNEENASQQENPQEEQVQNDANNETTEQKELTWEEKHAELNDKFLRLYAEFDNYRRRTNKERLDLIANANGALLKDILPVIDDFERAMLNNEKVEDPQVLKEGFALINNKLRSILESKGLKLMEVKGTPFDSELHEAIANVPVEDEEMKGKVIDDVEKGYYLNEKVIRYAKVVVGQ
jgi:molecular chaperone GrpE